jgi:hypothetical protein
MRFKGYIAIFLTFCTLAVTGCSSFERTAFQALTASKAIVDQAGKDYNAGTIPQTAAIKAVIETARNAQDTAADSLKEYHALAKAKTTGQPLVDAQNKVVAALTNLKQIVTDIKKFDTGAQKLPDPVLP